MVSCYDQLIQQGEIAGERKAMLKQLRRRFGNLDPATDQRVATATVEQLQIWITWVLSAATHSRKVLAD